MLRTSGPLGPSAPLPRLAAQDSHVSRFDEDPPHTHRMFDAMKSIEEPGVLMREERGEHVEHVNVVCLVDVVEVLEVQGSMVKSLGFCIFLLRWFIGCAGKILYVGQYLHGLKLHSHVCWTFITVSVNRPWS